MGKLAIEDLSMDAEMDRAAMTQIHGGTLPQPMTDLIQKVHDGTHPSTGSSGGAFGPGDGPEIRLPFTHMFPVGPS